MMRINGKIQLQVSNRYWQVKNLWFKRFWSESIVLRHYNKDWREIATKIHQITFENGLPNYFRTISSVWHGINTMITSTYGVQEALKEGIDFRLGDRRTISFYIDRWNDYGIMRETFPWLYAIASEPTATGYDVLAQDWAYSGK